ncbi:Inorganic pyrophosphatase 1 [Sesamum angolense]|uniref:Inorganic pyrophosphatase 1 n=1 Tax=Sesamum angolense TaxID=2727404 RepID=A0AAE1WL15_9LAMI|nr:Inorganic pyrophosphatase 1 [Sesamum angolense]
MQTCSLIEKSLIILDIKDLLHRDKHRIQATLMIRQAQNIPGMIIERIQASIAKEGKKRMIYLGDGSGDFCPSLKLKEGDFMMPRKNYPVWDLICENRALLRAEIHEWPTGRSWSGFCLN